MQSFQTFLLESFDKPVRWKWTFSNENYANAEFTVDKEPYLVLFEQHDEGWFVDFSFREGVAIQEKHNSQKVLATVLHIIKQFLEDRDPTELHFSAEKEGGVLFNDTLDRASAYKKLLRKFLPKEYSSKVSDERNETKFSIIKKR